MKAGLRQKGISHDSYSPDIEIRVTLTYNADNLLIREEQETDYVKNDVHHEYYSNGNKKKTVYEYTSLSPDGSSYTSTTEYDGVFDVRIRDRYESDGSVRETEYTNIHGIEFCVTIKEDGKIVREDKITQQTGSRIQTETYENGEHTFSTVFELDRNGYIVSSVITSMRKPEKPYKTFQYTYDQYGHLIRSVEKLDEFTTRTADYIWARRSTVFSDTDLTSEEIEKLFLDANTFATKWIERYTLEFNRSNSIHKDGFYYYPVTDENISSIEQLLAEAENYFSEPENYFTINPMGIPLYLEENDQLYVIPYEAGDAPIPYRYKLDIQEQTPTTCTFTITEWDTGFHHEGEFNTSATFSLIRNPENHWVFQGKFESFMWFVKDSQGNCPYHFSE